MLEGPVVAELGGHGVAAHGHAVLLIAVADAVGGRGVLVGGVEAGAGGAAVQLGPVSTGARLTSGQGVGEGDTGNGGGGNEDGAQHHHVGGDVCGT